MLCTTGCNESSKQIEAQRSWLSSWIDYLRNVEQPHVTLLHDLLTPSSPIVLTPIILQEILQRAQDDAVFAKYRAFFITQPFLHPLDRVNSHVQAAKLYQECRRIGVAIRSSVDCLIARIAMEQNAVPLHNDEDFRRIARVNDKLMQTSGSSWRLPRCFHDSCTWRSSSAPIL